ncbi:MAG: hypothetical protein JW726_07645 [Anaerolineales bacterium]|nr:hypothetical protein [Anaerolineales bacterium]
MDQRGIYRSTSQVPPLVRRAMNLATQMQDKPSCTDSIGRLLQLMVNQYQSGVIAEIGTECGCGAAWIISALAPQCSFITVEEDPAKAAAARALFENYPNVRVLHGKWQDLLFYKPLSMLYLNIHTLLDPTPAHEALLLALRMGGIIVLSGFVPDAAAAMDTPGDKVVSPPELQDRSAAERSFWLNDPRLLATELPINQSESLIVGSRVG